jgi:hypothetical protein
MPGSFFSSASYWPRVFVMNAHTCVCSGSFVRSYLMSRAFSSAASASATFFSSASRLAIRSASESPSGFATIFTVLAAASPVAASGFGASGGGGGGGLTGDVGGGGVGGRSVLLHAPVPIRARARVASRAAALPLVMTTSGAAY